MAKLVNKQATDQELDEWSMINHEDDVLLIASESRTKAQWLLVFQSNHTIIFLWSTYSLFFMKDP